MSTRIITDETMRETLSHGSEDYPFCYYPEDLWDYDFHCVDWHWHSEVEFAVVKEGTVVVMAETADMCYPREPDSLSTPRSSIVLKPLNTPLLRILFSPLRCLPTRRVCFITSTSSLF